MTTDNAPSKDRAITFLLRMTSVLWVIWGLVHVLAGVMTISQDTPEAVAGIADAVDKTELAGEYHAAVGAVINQHGFNLLWIGAVTTACAFFVWRRSTPAIFLAALVAGLADIGYFLFMDLGGHVNFVPGTVMTLICATAVAMSISAYFLQKSKSEST
ncbi:MAG: hypothetical protein AAGG48_17800 [Planctomycetota bacterium]